MFWRNTRIYTHARIHRHTRTRKLRWCYLLSINMPSLRVAAVCSSMSALLCDLSSPSVKWEGIRTSRSCCSTRCRPCALRYIRLVNNATSIIVPEMWQMNVIGNHWVDTDLTDTIKYLTRGNPMLKVRRSISCYNTCICFDTRMPRFSIIGKSIVVLVNICQLLNIR